MHREIIVSAFAKAKKQEIEETGLKGSNNKASERISAYISNVSDIPYSSRSLRNALNDASKPSKAVEILQPKVLNALCMYLEYDNYQHYLRASNVKNPHPKKPIETMDEGTNNSMIKTCKWLVIIGISIIIGVVLYFLSNRQRWMEWDTDHYVEVSFDPQKLQEGSLRLFKQERIKKFRKVLLTCDSVFFNVDASPKFWYGKNNQKQLEFYTELAKHPETGKALKPLSKYMIEKYICKE